MDITFGEALFNESQRGEHRRKVKENLETQFKRLASNRNCRNREIEG